MNTYCNRQALTPIILAFATLCLLRYLGLLLDPDNIGHPVAYGLLLIAELIGMFQLVGMWVSVIIAPPSDTPPNVIAAKAMMLKHPTIAGKVAVFVPVAGEPLEIVTQTLIAARDIRFPHETYVLDDGHSDDVKALANRLGINYIRRPEKKNWKAGNINYALKRVACDFVAIFDSDHVAKPEFLEETLPYLLVDPKVAFVQTPQHLVNRDTFVSEGIAETQEVFYRHIMVAKNKFNAAFCVGTNVVFRTKALEPLGGLYEKSHSEDIWTSLLLHEQGWKSVYVPMILATGLAPDTVDGYFRQQFRWASGAYELLTRRNPLLRTSLTLDQKLQYFHTAMFFLSGIAVFIFYLLPLLYVYLGWGPLQLAGGFWAWLTAFVPYFVLMLASTAHLIGKWPRWRTYVMAIGAFPAHISACIATLTGIRIRWSVSGVIRSNIDYVKSIMMHLLLLLLSLTAIPVLFVREQEGTTGLVTAFWLLWNSGLLIEICRRAIPRRKSSASVTITDPLPA